MNSDSSGPPTGLRGKRTQLDAIDLQILDQLQRDARQTNMQLAARVSLSPSACLSRVKRLEKSGVIAAYRAVINLAHIGSSLKVIAHVTLEHHRSQDFRRFDNAVAAIPEVVEAHQVNGAFDYALTIVCRDIDRYREINDQIVDGQLGVGKVESHIVLTTTRPFSGVALSALVKPVK